MKIFLSIKYHLNHENRPLIEEITQSLSPHKTICIARDVEQWGAQHFAPAELMRRTFAEIDSSDIVLVELSEKGVGIGIEAGYAYAKGKKIIAVAHAGCEISEALKGISAQVMTYHSATEIKSLLGAEYG